MRILFTIFSLLLGMQPLLLAETNALLMNQELSGLDIWPHSEYQLDGSDSLDMTSIQISKEWHSTRKIPSSMPYVIGAMWIKTQLINKDSESQTYLLDHSYTLTDQIAITLIQANGQRQTMKAGDRVVAEGAVIRSRNPVFELKIPPGESTLYIKVKSSGLVSGKFEFWNPLLYFNKVNLELAFVSVLLGALLILVLYNLFLYFSLGTKVYIHYVAYLLAFLMIQLVFSGVGRIFFHDMNPVLIWCWNEGLHVCIKLAEAFSCSFALHFLNLNSHYPRLAKAFRYFTRVLILSVFTGFLFSYRTDSIFVVFITIATTSFLLAIGIWSSLRGYRPAFYYTAGWAVLLIATIVVALRTGGLLPINLFTNWAQIAGAAIEGLVLSLALGERYNFLQSKATADRERYIKKLVEKEASKAHSYTQLEKMIYPHQIELIKTGSNLEQTMPTGQGEACVLSLDTVASSKLERTKARTFLSDVFAECYRSMLDGYDKRKMTASAYRLKEVGDGFFCSVGFPFHTPEAQNPAEVALSLALKFSKIFQKHSILHEFQNIPQCSIAIAFGEVEAYYPSAGVLEYNLFGRGIVLADRYEKLRKSILKQVPFTGNILVIDARVHAMLGETSQQRFQLHSIDRSHPIRDDELAECLYYCLLNPAEDSKKLPHSA